MNNRTFSEIKRLKEYLRNGNISEDDLNILLEHDEEYYR